MDFVCCRKYIRDEYKQPDEEMDKYVLDEKKFVEDVIKSDVLFLLTSFNTEKIFHFF